MTHDNLRERIAGQREGFIFSDCLFLCSQRIGGLNVGLFAAGGCNEVDFPRDRSDPSFGIFLIAIDDANVNGAFTDISSLKMMFSMICVFPADGNRCGHFSVQCPHSSIYWDSQNSSCP